MVHDRTLRGIRAYKARLRSLTCACIMLAGTLLLSEGCPPSGPPPGYPMGTEARRTYSLPCKELQSIVEKELSGMGFSTWTAEESCLETAWQAYSVGERGWWLWRKEWQHRTRLKVRTVDRVTGTPGAGAALITCTVSIGSETQDSPAGKDRWNHVARPTAGECDLVKLLIDGVDVEIEKRRSEGKEP